MPMYLIQARGKLDLTLNPVDVAAIMQLPESTAMKITAHELLTGINPWNSLDDLELIKDAREVEWYESKPIWKNVTGHDKFTTPMQAVDSILAEVVAMLKLDFAVEENKEKFGNFIDKFERM